MTRSFAAILALSGTISLVFAQGSGAPPPNEPAVVELATDRIVIRYHGA